MSFAKLPPEIVASVAMQEGFPPVEALAMQETARAYHGWLQRSQAALDRGETPVPIERSIDRAMSRFEQMWDIVAPPKWRLVLPFKKLDAIIGPLLGGEILTIAGTTAGGKTTTTMNLIRGLMRSRTRMHLVATEMSRREIIAYLMGFDNHLWPEDLVTNDYLRAGDHTGLTEGQLMDLCSETVRWWHNLQRDHISAPLTTTSKILRASELPGLFADCERTKRDVLIIDHLGLFDHDLPARTQYLAEQGTIRSIKALAEKHDIAVVLVSQINMTRYHEGDIMGHFHPPKAHHLFGGQQLPFVSSAMLTIYRPKAETYGPDREAVTRPFIREHMNNGGEIEDLFEPGVTGFSACKIRRGTRSPVRRITMHYRRAYLFDDLPDFRTWFGRSPAALRLQPRGDAWEPGAADDEDSAGNEGS